VWATVPRHSGAKLESWTAKSAKERYRGVDISFIQADVLDLPREANYYDAFVSLETVEHIPDTIAYLKEIRRVLRPGGKFYCSTPNRQVTNPGTAIQDKPYNPWHLFEFSPSEFETQLRQVFEDVQLFGQGFFKTPYISTLESIGMTSPPIAVRIHQLRKVATAPFMRAAHYSPHSLLSTPTKIPECLLAVCS
jgi:SAM-dependent methyltransferase